MTESPARRLVVQIHYGHPNDYDSVAYERWAWSTFGYEVTELSINDPQSGARLTTLIRERGGEIFCFVSANYCATRIRNGEKLLHDITGIPLVIEQYTTPVFFLGEQSPGLDGTILFVVGDDSADFVRRYYSVKSEIAVRVGTPSRYDAGPPSFEQFAARHNTMLCPINLVFGTTNMDGFWAHIKALPERRRKAAVRLIEAALTEWRLPLHIVAERLQLFDDPAEAAQALPDQWLVFNFLKLWRRDKLIRAVVDLPVLISSEYVPSDLEFSHPEKFKFLRRPQTMKMYHEYRFTLNANPPGMNFVHERFGEPLISNAVCVTDRNLILENHFKDEESILYFDYDRDDSVSKIARYFENPELAYELTVKAYQTRSASKNLQLQAGYGNLIDVVQAQWDLAAAARERSELFAG